MKQIWGDPDVFSSVGTLPKPSCHENRCFASAVLRRNKRNKKGGSIEAAFSVYLSASLRSNAQCACEERPTVIAAMRGFDQVFRMRHHAEHIAACIDDTGDVVD